MLFDLKNGPSIFQYYINNMLHEFFDVFVIVYIDNILIYLSILSEHRKHIRIILKYLKDIRL